MNNIYTAVGDGNYVRIYNALNGTQVNTRNMGNPVLTCVCAGDVLTVTIQLSPHTRYLYTYKLPHFNLINSVAL
jgi:hypothetical protein